MQKYENLEWGIDVAKKKRKQKALEELTIVDDFMFGAVMSEPKRCKPLLEYILGVEIERIEYPDLQKTIDKQYKSKAVRLDVYVADGKGTVYNIEIQTTKKKNLPKRTRYYQGMIDLNIIDKGKDYTNLKKSYVIFICTYDPFDAGRYVYTFENQCQEDGSIYLGDDATKIILNTEGTVGNINEDLKDTLDFMAGRKPKGSYAKGLENAVDEVKESEKWRREYMTLFMRDKENQRLGRLEQTVTVIRRGQKKLEQGKLGYEELIDLADTNKTTYDKIIDLINDHPDWDDEDIADEFLEQEE